MCTTERCREGCEIAVVGTITTNNKRLLSACKHCLTVDGHQIKLNKFEEWAVKKKATINLNQLGTKLVADRNLELKKEMVMQELVAIQNQLTCAC